ncbi:MATE family efflux transporter [uncultured Desulfovibrio sp.]|uniref:MATE family efflux transporter n=1 Tax=uncultured Desulfovibrio sp. TaxID=167968 RepID=UPI0026361C8E|nr:MATE family efflux transporter [uncultured Desulfovibrio sp.]
MLRDIFSPAEARQFVRLGLPVLIAQTTQMGMNFVDTAMTGQYGRTDMAAVAVAGSVWAPVSLLGVGCLLALPPLTAQLVGAGKKAEAAQLLRQGIWLSCAIGGLLMIVFSVLSRHLSLFGLEGRMADLAGGYLRAMLWGLPGLMLFINIRSFLEGFSRTRPAMIVGILGLMLNVPVNYVFIYGKLGLPQLGAVGCGVATAICFWFMAFCMLFYVRRDSQYRHLRPLFLPMFRPGLAHDQNGSPFPRFDPALALRILRIGLPGALAVCFEVSLFAMTAILLAPLGEIVVSGHQIALNYSTMIFMLPLSLNITATIRVGYLLGAQRFWRARVAARTVLCLGMSCSLVAAVCTLLFREQIIAIYMDDAQVAAFTMQLLLFTAAYQFVDAVQTISIGILRGYNDTRIISVVCLLSYWGIGLPLGYTLARTDWLASAPLGAQGFWTAYLLALGFGALCYTFRLRHLHRLDDAAILHKIHR